jgi:TRAP-type C4-dicarboxylate transport system permease small subunit
MQRIIDWVVKVTDLVIMAIMIALFGIMLTGIVFRYILNDSLQWSDEILVWGLVWIIMLGSVGVMAQWRHVYVPVCVLALPTRWRIPVVILSKIVTMIFIALIAYYGFEVFQSRFHRVSVSLDLSSRWEKLAMPVGAALMLCVGILQIVLDVRAWLAGELSRFATYGDSDLDI